MAKDIPHNQTFVETDEEELLWQQMRQGSHVAYKKLYLAYVGELYRYGNMVIREKSLVEDTIHDVFSDVWSSRANLGEVSSVRLYLFSSFKRRLLRKIKKERQWQFVQDKNNQEISFEVVPSFLDEQIETHDHKMLVLKMQKYVEHLSPRQREVIYLRFYQNLSYAEIASLLELDQKYTYNLASKAFQMLREIISKTITAFGLLIAYSIY
jgi:RNA polymerase sigma factor (sigma-70 family)